MLSLLGEKFIFFNSLGTTKIAKNFNLFVFINVVLLINFPDNLSYASTSNIREVIKFYDLGDKKILKQTLVSASLILLKVEKPDSSTVFI